MPCPASVIAYNTFMGGVDRGDQLRGYYSCRTKSRKFYKYIFHFLLDTSITNAYILLKPHSTYQHVKDFRVQLAKELIGDFCVRRRPGSGAALQPLPLRHFPVKLTFESRHQRGRCAQCKTRNIRRDSCWHCRECNVGLCHAGDPKSDCFLLWHARMEHREE